MLTITDYKPYKRAVRGRVGVRADFRVKPVPKEGVVYQKVTSRYTLGGRTRTYQFTEAWRVGKRRRETGRIEQNGTDSFLVDKGDVKRAKGELRVKAVAWYEPGKVDGQMRKGEGDNLWGGLRGRMGHKAVPAGARTITRKAVAKWAKGGTVEWTLGAAKVKGGQVVEASGDSEGGASGRSASEAIAV